MNPGRLLDLVRAAPPEAPALIVIDGATAERLSYGELLQDAEAWAARLPALGLARGDVIALWLANSAAWVAIELAAAWLGLLVAPVNPRLRAADAHALLAASKAKCLIAPRTSAVVDIDALVADAQAGLPHLAHVMRIDASRPAPAACKLAPATDDLPLNCFSTSGSTGAPKLAAHRQSAIVTRFWAAADRFDIRAGDALLCVLPLCGVWGLGITLAALMRGATAVMISNFDAPAAADAMARFGIAHLHGGDNLIREVLSAPNFDGAALPAWRTCYFGAFTGRPAEETIAYIEQSGAPQVRAAQAYGSSEGLAFITGCAVTAPLEQRARAGGPMIDDATQVRVVDESGMALQNGASGEIQLRGATVTIGYHENPDATAAAFTADNWFKTGDLGFMTSDGVVFVARMGDALRLRGNLVDPAEIENHLCTHPGVAEAHVVGVRGEAGDVAVAFVAPARVDLTEAELIAFCRARIASFKIPARIIVTDDIPRTPGVNAAKVQKNVLRERAQAYLETPFKT